MVETSVQLAGHVFESSSRIGRILIAYLKLWLSKICQHCRKTRLFSPHRLHNTKGGGLLDIDLGCGFSAFSRDFLLQDFSPTRRLESRLLFSFPSSSFATPPATSGCFVDANRAVFFFLWTVQLHWYSYCFSFSSEYYCVVCLAPRQWGPCHLWLFGIWLVTWLH